MIVRVFFITILILLTALFGVAQEDVVYEDAEIIYSVDNIPGSNYTWEVYTQLNPDIQAQSTEYYFTTSSNANSVGIHWSKTGLYYLKVIETDAKGCTNNKAHAVTVLSNDRYIGFTSSKSRKYFSSTNNGFEIPLEIIDNNGQPLASSYFPLNVEFTVEGDGHNQNVGYSNRKLKINNQWISASARQSRNIEVEIIGATDNVGGIIKSHPQKSTHIRAISAIPALEFITDVGKIVQGESFEHKVKLDIGNPANAEYSWNISPLSGTSTKIGDINNNSATIVWDGDVGIYTLSVRVLDGNGYLTEYIYKEIEVIEPPNEELEDLYVDLGNDTTINACNSYVLQANVSDSVELTYQWEPSDKLDDPFIANPSFNPVQTTTFKLTVTDSLGRTAFDVITVTVSDIFAEAGESIFMRQGETAILDGTGSIGEGLQYKWTTNNGTIDHGGNSINPVISSFGTYYLEVTDRFGCTSNDSVKVEMLSFAPIAIDDYDTTSYKTEVKIAVLNNDTDPENDIDPLSLAITELPYNGLAYVDYNDFTIHYTPNHGFSGNDIFGYQICDINSNCDRANVYVLVTDYQFLIPDAFSPNGDNINDYFEIIGIDRFEGNTIKIFNRWGNKVYQAINYGISTTPQFWEGKSNTGFLLSDEDLPTGTYYYVLDLGNGENPIAGSIYLDR